MRRASSGLGTLSPYLSPLSPLLLACGVPVALHHASLSPRVATAPGDDDGAYLFRCHWARLMMIQTKRDDIVRAYAEAVNIWQELGDRPDRYPTYLAPI
jgi:hypothetical protein